MAESKTVQILVKQHLIVHLSKDQKVELQPGINQVDEELSKHWYVLANSQPISNDSDAGNESLLAQLEEAKGKITALQSDLKAKDDELVATKKELEEAKAQNKQTPSDEKKPTASKGKEETTKETTT